MVVFELNSEGGVGLVFTDRYVDESGWVSSYALHARAPGFHAEIRVENPGFGFPPSVLFEDIASHWSGWNGEKGWSALEGECAFAATCDSTGHITLTLRLLPHALPPCWHAQVALVLEAGSLERVARDAATFFERQRRGA